MVISENDEFYQAGGALDIRRPLKIFAPVNLLNRVEANAEVSGDNAQHFLEVAGTLPTSPNAPVSGVAISINSAGVAPQPQSGATVDLTAGYTGAGITIGLVGRSFGASTDANYGLVGQAFGASTPGDIVGVLGSSFPGASVTGKAVGILGLAAAGGTGVHIGTFGAASFGSVNVGVAAIYGNTHAPSYENAALLADNKNDPVPIILARDNGAIVWSVQDGGSLQGKMATKDLTEGAPTAFVRFTLAANSGIGGLILYSIEALDGVDQQIITGVQPFAAVNKAGAVTAALGTPAASTEIELSPVGSLTNAFDTVNAANTFDIRANATSSLAQTTLRISYQVHLYNNAVITVTNI